MTLGPEQQEALQMLKDFLNSTQVACLVFGPAGTGKSLLIDYLVKYLDNLNKDYCLCAPTHKAALVMERYTGCDAITLHKLLSLSPNLDIFELDFRNLMFRTSHSVTQFPYNGVVICDEASMINDDLYKLLIEKAKAVNCKVCFFGDFKQLAPVKQNSLSCIIGTEPQKELTKVYRQSEDNGLMPVLHTLRTKPINKFQESLGIEGKLEILPTLKDFVKLTRDEFRKAIKQGDVLGTKLTAFTNAKVNTYNQAMHKVLFSDDKEYHKGEFITGCDNLEFNNFKFYNSMDYVIIDEPTQTDIHIPDFMVLPAWQINLFDSLENKSSLVSILSNAISQDYLDALAYKLESLRLAAVEMKSISRLKANKLWQDYYKILGSFTVSKHLFFDGRLIRKRSFMYGYASTVHRLQGSSYNSIFVDMTDIGLCKDDEARRQLQYVALSRTRSNAYIYQ